HAAARALPEGRHQLQQGAGAAVLPPAGVRQDRGAARRHAADRAAAGDRALTTATVAPLTKKDFESDQEVRWCPGCGDYAILTAVQSVVPELGIPRERFVVVSGIGCSSRFPYYMNTYGFHTIHGRAPAVATGLKVSRPDLDVW